MVRAPRGGGVGTPPACSPERVGAGGWVGACVSVCVCERGGARPGVPYSPCRAQLPRELAFPHGTCPVCLPTIHLCLTSVGPSTGTSNWKSSLGILFLSLGKAPSLRSPGRLWVTWQCGAGAPGETRLWDSEATRSLSTVLSLAEFASASNEKPLGGMGGARRATSNFVFRFNGCDGGNDGWTPGLTLAEAPWELLRFPHVTRFLGAPTPAALPFRAALSVLSLHW